jgi:hypothetical protein
MNQKTIAFIIENDSDETKKVILFDEEYAKQPDAIIPQPLALYSKESQEIIAYDVFINNLFAEKTLFGVDNTQIVMIKGQNAHLFEISPNIFFPKKEAGLLLVTAISPQQFRSDAILHKHRYPLYKGVSVILPVPAKTKIEVFFLVNFSAMGDVEDFLSSPEEIDEKFWPVPVFKNPIEDVIENMDKKLDEILSFLKKEQ